MRKLSEILRQVQNGRTAIGHFNVADLVLIKAVMGAARELNVRVLVGASEGERHFMGTRQLAAVVSSLREEFDFPIFLNADHTHSLTIVHINTELRLTWRHGLEDGLHQREDAIVPYKVLPSAVASVQQVVSSRLKLFTNPVAEIHAQRN